MSKETDDNTMNLVNPFKAHQKRGNEDTLKYCAWEVLKAYPQGLEISLLAKEIQDRRLRDLSKMKNAVGQISSELVRTKEAFSQAPEQKIWWIRPLAPSEFAHPTVSSTSISEAQRPRGEQLEGHRVAVWWKGERKYFEGVIDSFDAATDSYTVVYDDGDTDDGLELRRYEVGMKDERIDVVTVFEHNLDDVDEETSSQPKGVFPPSALAVVEAALFAGTVTSKEDGSDWTYSTTQAACSADSRTGPEVSDVTPRKGSKRLREGKSRGGRSAPPKERRKQRTATGSRGGAVRSLNREDGANAVDTPGTEVSGPRRGTVTLKRKNELMDQGNEHKKTKFEEETVDLTGAEDKTGVRADVATATGQRLEKKLLRTTCDETMSAVPLPISRGTLSMLEDGVVAMKAAEAAPVGCSHPGKTDLPASETTLQEIKPVVMESEEKARQGITTIKSEEPAAEQPRARKVETIDVLDLTRQLQPPEDKRPDLKNLTDVSELMSLSELSDQLKLLPDGEEVTSNADVTINTSKESKTCKRSCADSAAKRTAGTEHPVAGERHGNERTGVILGPKGAEAAIGQRTVPSVESRTQRSQSMLERHRVLDSALYGDVRMLPRGRDLLSPSILSKHQSGMNSARTTHPSSSVTSVIGRHGLVSASTVVSSVRADDRVGAPVSGQLGRQPDWAKKGPTQVSEIRNIGKVSGDSTARNNEASGQTLVFEGTPYPSHPTSDQPSTGREQWKDRFSVAEGR